MPDMPVVVHWFRRDLRLEDNAALYAALRSGHPVVPVFIFDRHILDELAPDDARVSFIHREIGSLKDRLRSMGSDLVVLYGYPEQCWLELLVKFEVTAVYTNRDYEPYARSRDEAISTLLGSRGISFRTSKDHVVFEAGEVVKDDGSPYTVFTPYSRKWKAMLTTRSEGGLPFWLKPYPVERYLAALHRFGGEGMITLEQMGFVPSSAFIPPRTVPGDLVRHYADRRDYPGMAGTSHLGIHLRFGTVSVRHWALQGLRLSDTFLGELIWRDFYSQILAFFPYVAERAFKPVYDRIMWRDSEEDFGRWCAGMTGYPLVDAGMRELNATGYMHNRVRMVTASFLAKHLLIDWRWGEAYFASKLLDFDLASNNGGWQWAAGCGTDAAPYFRIFNPIAQAARFDPKGDYMLDWVPEYGTPAYPAPMVDHTMARARCLAVYKAALQDG